MTLAIAALITSLLIGSVIAADDADRIDVAVGALTVAGLILLLAASLTT